MKMPARKLSLPHQTLYAELVELCATAAFEDEFPEPGSFSFKEVKGRRYWYFEPSGQDVRRQRYVGPESPELLARVQERRTSRSRWRVRRQMVSALRRAGAGGPDAATAQVLAALAKSGMFRLRAVLVGTVAFQIYAPILGVRLAHAALRTGDIDVAQMHEISVAVNDSTPPPLEVLRSVDPTFGPVPNLERHPTSYVNDEGLRIDFLAKRREAGIVALPALRAYARALPYLDYLIAEPLQAVVLSGSGVLVNVPNPARYAWHKLVVAGLRQNQERVGKDIEQAAALIGILAEQSAVDLVVAAQDFMKDQRKRKDLLYKALSRLPIDARDAALRVLGSPRRAVPGAHLVIPRLPARWDSDREVVVFSASEGGIPVQCAISREALEDHFGSEQSRLSELEVFRQNRDEIERLAEAKYLDHAIEPRDQIWHVGVLLRSTDRLPWPKRRAGRGRSG